MIELYLPYPPSVNDYYGHNKYQVYLKPKGKQYREEVIKAVNEQLGGGIQHSAKDSARVRYKVTIDVTHPEKKRKRDLDNLLKALLDSLTHSKVIEDDSLINELTIRRISNKDDLKNGYVQVTVVW